MVEESICGSSGAERMSGPIEVHHELCRVSQAELNILVQLCFHLLIGAALGHQPGTEARENKDFDALIGKLTFLYRRLKHSFPLLVAMKAQDERSGTRIGAWLGRQGSVTSLQFLWFCKTFGVQRFHQKLRHKFQGTLTPLAVLGDTENPQVHEPLPVFICIQMMF